MASPDGTSSAHSVGLLSRSYQPHAQDSTLQHTALTRENTPYPQGDSKTELQQIDADSRLRQRGHWN